MLQAVNPAESAERDLVEITTALIAEVERWTSGDWRTACDVHGETSDAMHLVLHIAARCRHVTAVIRGQFQSQVVSAGTHSHVDPAQPEPAAAVAALKHARDEALEVVRDLNDEDIQRLHATEIDGESDVLVASCGLIGHWKFHFLPLLKVRGSA